MRRWVRKLLVVMLLRKKWLECVTSASVWAHFCHADVCWLDSSWSTDMSPLRRKPVSKHSSAKRFRKATTRTKAANMTGPMRGGIRL